MARAVAVQPKFLLLDEPAAGLDDAESLALTESIAQLREQLGCGVLLVEHDMRIIFRICERIQVLDYGKSIAVGTPEEIRTNKAVIAAYLGEKGERRMLQLTEVTVHYGRIAAVNKLSLEVKQGELVGVVGHNGAGKSTTLWTITGVLKPSAGQIVFQGEPIGGKSPEEILRRGIALVPENRRIFGRLTVGENLKISTSARTDRRAAAVDIKRMCERFEVLGRYYDRSGSKLSGGEQQQLAIARALLARPSSSCSTSRPSGWRRSSSTRSSRFSWS